MRPSTKPGDCSGNPTSLSDRSEMSSSSSTAGPLRLTPPSPPAEMPYSTRANVWLEVHDESGR